MITGFVVCVCVVCITVWSTLDSQKNQTLGHFDSADAKYSSVYLAKQ